MSVIRLDGYFLIDYNMVYEASVWGDNYKLLLLIEWLFDDDTIFEQVSDYLMISNYGLFKYNHPYSI